MPAGYTHYTFGQLVFNQLSLDKQKIISEHLDLYNIGIHGPDILFYYDALHSNKISQLGSIMHREEAYSFFLNAKDIIKESHDKEASLVYVYGFITHFILDHACHYYVNEVEKSLNLTHTEIESELDREILARKGLDPLRTSLTSHIHFNHYITQIIAPFFNLNEKDIYKALKDLLFYLGFIKAPGHLKRNFVYLMMKIGGIYDSHKGLLINYEANPITKECTNVLLSKMEDAVITAVQLIEEFDCLPLNDIYHNDFE